jgi:hypothetical protein
VGSTPGVLPQCGDFGRPYQVFKFGLLLVIAFKLSSVRRKEEEKQVSAQWCHYGQKFNPLKCLPRWKWLFEK